MAELLTTWWPVLALAYVPALVQLLMTIIVKRQFRRIDELHPDDLPYTGGEWLNLEIIRLGYLDRINVIVTDREAKASLDAYHPQHATIQLTAETYFKRDPMHWAIAAHELGHARFKLDHPVLGQLLIAARIIKGILLSLGLALMLGNIVYALPGITELAFELFIGGAILHVGVMFDEAVASILAMRSLYAHDEFAYTHLRSARRTLVLAYMTYVVSFAVRLLMLTQWHLIAELSRVPNVPPFEDLTVIGTIVAAVTSLYAFYFGLDRVRALFMPLRYRESALRKTLFQLALLVLVTLVWNHRADREFAVCVMLALTTISGWFIAIVSMPMAIIHVLLIDRFTRKLEVDPTHRTAELRRDLAKGAELRKSGNAALSVLLEKTDDVHPLYGHVLVNLTRVAHLPLLIVYWLGG